MDIITDASIIIATITNEPNKPAIIRMTGEADLMAPASVHWEIGNAFSAMFKRNRISLERALQALDFYYQIPIRFVEVELAETLQLAYQLNLYAYDAYLIRCAQKYGAPLFSLDENLLRSAEQINLSTIRLSK